jgi:hypothetical protein
MMMMMMMIVVVMRMMIFVHLMIITISSYSFHNCYSCKWVIKKPAIKVADRQHKAPQFLGFLYEAVKLWIIITLAIDTLCEPTKKILKLSLSLSLSASGNNNQALKAMLKNMDWVPKELLF